MSPQDYDRYVDETFIKFDQIGKSLRSEFSEISNANPSYFDVNVKSRRSAQEYVEQLEKDEVDLDAQRQDFYGFKPATERFQEYARENRLGYTPSGTPTGSPPAAGITGSADPGLLMQIAGYGGIAANKLLDGLEYLERPQQSLKGALAEGGEGAKKGLLGEEKYKWGYDKPVTRGFGRYGVGRQVMTPEQQELYSDLMLDPLDLVFGAVGKAGGALSKFIRRSDSP